MPHFDSHTNQYELEVKRIIYLQNLANKLLDAFIDIKKVTKSHILAVNGPTRIDVPKGQLANESQIRIECHGPIPGPTQMTDPNRVRDARPCTGTLYLLN